MSKQTAVEWLIKEFSEILGPLETKPMQDLLMMEAMKRAKQMDKEQKLEMLIWLDETDRRPHQIEEQFEQYYKETYGTK